MTGKKRRTRTTRRRQPTLGLRLPLSPALALGRNLKGQITVKICPGEGLKTDCPQTIVALDTKVRREARDEEKLIPIVPLQGTGHAEGQGRAGTSTRSITIVENAELTTKPVRRKGRKERSDTIIVEDQNIRSITRQRKIPFGNSTTSPQTSSGTGPLRPLERHNAAQATRRRGGARGVGFLGRGRGRGGPWRRGMATSQASGWRHFGGGPMGVQ